ncbi:hypothetical protein BJ875DRAFT_382341 [Amylocarpus encephaloides]|uniref:Uncharacterized protein n=1 Tax=Amylocarpus encephaloides TaxID=45428 RepID=A0A9P7YEV1_9HELO|nr:hypothetical protein BJ875DRAFT_382341 [Amylocarpus encephaloides]
MDQIPSIPSIFAIRSKEPEDPLSSPPPDPPISKPVYKERQVLFSHTPQLDLPQREFIPQKDAPPTLKLICALLNIICSPGFIGQPPARFTFFPFQPIPESSPTPYPVEREFFVASPGCDQVNLHMDNFLNCGGVKAVLKTYVLPIERENLVDIATKARYSVHCEAWLHHEMTGDRMTWPTHNVKDRKPIVMELVVSWEAEGHVMEGRKNWEDVVSILRRASVVFDEFGRMEKRADTFTDEDLGVVKVDCWEWPRL